MIYLLVGAIWLVGIVGISAIDERAREAQGMADRLPPAVAILWPIPVAVMAAVGAVVGVCMVPVWIGRWIARRLAAREEAPK